MAFNMGPKGNNTAVEEWDTGAGSQDQSVGFSSHFFGGSGDGNRNANVLGSASDQRSPMSL
jgi:hypothetical protein